MIDSQRRKLKNRQTISESTVQGWPSIVVSLPFTIAGVGIILVALNVIPSNDESFRVPREWVAILGLVFALAGLSLAVHGVKGLRQKARRDQLLSRHPGEPWLSDYRWSSHRAHDQVAGRWLRNLYSLALMVLFLMPFNGLVFFSKNSPDFIFLIVTVLFDLIIILGLGYQIYLWGRRLKYGTGELVFGGFPYFLGDTFEATLVIPRSAAQLHTLTVTLRYIEETYEKRSQERSKQVMAYQIWADVKTLEKLRAPTAGPCRLPISFDLPANEAYSTSLSSRPARYWELEVNAEAPGIDYGCSFLVPVYSRIH